VRGYRALDANQADDTHAPAVILEFRDSPIHCHAKLTRGCDGRKGWTTAELMGGHSCRTNVIASVAIHHILRGLREK